MPHRPVTLGEPSTRGLQDKPSCLRWARARPIGIRANNAAISERVAKLHRDDGPARSETPPQGR